MLSVADVRFSYDGQHEVLAGLNLRVRDGEIVALVGPNGAGKTTLARLVMALLQPTSGEIEVNGLSTAGRNPEDMAPHVGYLFQHVDNQLLSRTVADEVAFGPRQLRRSVAAAEIAGILESVALGDRGNTHPFDLAPVERKRLGLASIMAQGSSLWILDEPTQGMDRNGIELFARVVRDHAVGGGSALVISHDLSFVAESCDRVVGIAQGERSFERDTADALYDTALLATHGLGQPPGLGLARILSLPESPLREQEIVAALARRC
ncbi:MAG: energy-coupling factor ABC transporter ATP-binding protein [Gemmatimonadota bacterium]